MIKTKLCDMLNIQYPIIQAGMGPFSTAQLASAVSNAGGMGTVSIPWATGGSRAVDTIVSHLHYVKNNTNKNFAVNTPIASIKTSPQEVLKTHDAMIRAVCEEKKKDPELKKRLILYITSGGDPASHHKMIKEAGLLHFHVCGSVKHAQHAEELGLDGVIASGYEMGGHTHLTGRTVHTFILVPSVTQTVKIPVVASGGICDGATFAAVLAMGAVGVQMGTRFITTRECEFHEKYKKAIIDAGEFSDIVVQSFISPARMLKNPGAQMLLEAQEKVNRGEMDPTVKAKLVEDSLRAGEESGDVVNGAVAAGQNSSRIKEIKTVQAVMSDMTREAEKIISDINQLITK